MKITADTNVLVRAIVADDAKQARSAQAALAGARLVTITSIALCEFVWVLTRGHGAASAEVAIALRRLIASDNVAIDRPAVEAGLAMLEAGGDFADGVIAFEGAALRGGTFVSFDKAAVKQLNKMGRSTMLLT